MPIAIVCFSGCDVIYFKINLTFRIKQFFDMTKKLRQEFKYIENEKSFQGEIKINESFSDCTFKSRFVESM